ncbi:MAG: tetratricopeptide repeat protein, partial [Bacteroidota bacterium]
MRIAVYIAILSLLISGIRLQAQSVASTQETLDTSLAFAIQQTLALAENYLENDLDSAEFHAKWVLDWATEPIYVSERSKAHTILGMGASQKGDFSTSFSHLSEALCMLKEENGELPAIRDQLIVQKELAEVTYHLGSSTASYAHFDQVVQMAQSLSDRYFLIEGLNGQAKVLNQQGKYMEAMAPLKRAFLHASRQRDTTRQVGILNQLATNYFSIGDYDSSQTYFQTLLKLKRKEGNRRALVSDLTQLGNMFSDKQGEHHLAQAYYLEALEIAEDLSDSLLLVSTLTDMGKAFSSQENWNKASEYSRRGLQIAEDHNLRRWIAENLCVLGAVHAHRGNEEKALNSYRTALAIYEKEIPDPIQIARISLEMGDLLEQNSNYSESLKVLNTAYSLKKEVLDKDGMLDAQLLMANIMLEQNKIPEALKSLKLCEALSEELQSKHGKEQTYRMMAEAYEDLGNFKSAFTYQNLFTLYRDSLFNEERDRYINEQEEKYQAEQKDRLNAELEAEIAQRKANEAEKNSLLEARRRQVYLLIGGLGALGLFFLFLWYVNNKRQQLLKQRLIALQKEQEAENLRFMISGEERERQRIARELHDGMGSLLASVKFMFNAVQNDAPDIRTISNYQKADQMLDKACQEVREISHNLMPGVLDQYGLEYAIQQEIRMLQDANDLEIDFITYGLDQQDLGYNLQMSVYRITQEMLRNISKHAEATEVLVQLQVEEEMLMLTVEDNGKGFDPEEVKNSNGIGLENMHSRVVYLQGKMEVDSQIGKGTSIQVEIP